MNARNDFRAWTEPTAGSEKEARQRGAVSGVGCRVSGRSDLLGDVLALEGAVQTGAVHSVVVEAPCVLALHAHHLALQHAEREFDVADMLCVGRVEGLAQFELGIELQFPQHRDVQRLAPRLQLVDGQRLDVDVDADRPHFDKVSARTHTSSSTTGSQTPSSTGTT
eukprot:2306047-Rhodomonas_salina.2